jgi:pteridine reductase
MIHAGKVALVTGAARRVGRVLALELGRAGFDVVVHYNRSGDEADATASEIRGLGRRAHTVAGDLADAPTCAQVVAQAVAALGRLDLLVNNASIFERRGLDAIEAADWDRVHAINVRAPFLLSRAAAPHLKETTGQIINIADLSAFQAWPSYIHHGVSKAGLVHLSRNLARALAPDVRVNCIAPGTVLPAEHEQDELSAAAATRRLVLPEGRPDDVVRALLYLVSSPFVTGEVLVVDGGRLLL